MQVQKAAKARGPGLGALHYSTSLPIVTSRSKSPSNTSPKGLWQRALIVPYLITPRCEAKGQVAIDAMLVLTGEGSGWTQAAGALPRAVVRYYFPVESRKVPHQLVPGDRIVRSSVIVARPIVMGGVRHVEKCVSGC